MPRVVAIIPARYASSRFPGKALADKTGKPLIQHVYERATAAALVEDAVIATDDQRIRDAVRAFGGQAIMTRADHPNGTCRLAEAAEAVNADVIVNVQGDEPEIDPKMIDLTVQRLLDEPIGDPGASQIATLASPFSRHEDASDPHVVKVVIDQDRSALYFSRSLIPYDREGRGTNPPLKHLGLYVYRREFLATYVSLPATPLEQTEQLEQLRVLEHGYSIAVAVGNAHFHGIDTPEQYDRFVQRYKTDHANS